MCGGSRKWKVPEDETSRKFSVKLTVEEVLHKRDGVPVLICVRGKDT